MDAQDIDHRANEVLQRLLSNQDISRFVDANYPIPKVFCGKGDIRLIILGQDPTVKNAKSRAKIKTVLNLDRNNALRRYLEEICDGLGIDLDENVYATNLYKNFFIDPPTQIKEINIFEAFSLYWLPLLQDELSMFPEVPVISLGEPLLETLVSGDASPKVREYWGYTSRWKAWETGPFNFLNSVENILDRVIYPFPHQPSLSKQFYRGRLPYYVDYVKRSSILSH